MGNNTLATAVTRRLAGLVIRRLSMAILIGAAMLLGSCGSDTAPTVVVEQVVPVPTTVTISADGIVLLSLGDGQQIAAVVRDQEGVVNPDWSVDWTSTDEAVATVTTDGLITAVANGQTTVMATVGPISDTIPVEVVQGLRSVRLSTVSVVLGGPTDTASVSVIALDGGGSPIVSSTVTWSSDDPTVVRSLGAGLFFAVGVGTASVNAMVEVGPDTIRGAIAATVLAPPTLLPDERCADFPYYAIATLADSALEIAVRAELGLNGTEGLTCDTLSRLRQVTAWSQGITSLGGLQNAPELTSLSLTGNSIADIGPVRDLTGLRVLVLGGNPVSDLSPIEGLTALTRLDAQGGTFSSVASLDGHPTLTRLLIDGAPVLDITPLSNIGTLSELGLSQTPISDLAALASLSNLTWLDVGNTGVTDLTGLEGASSLEVLHARNLTLSDLTPLAALSNLEFLAVFNSSVTDIGPLAGLVALRTLEAGSNSISDISALASLTRLTRLSLGQNSITDVASLEGLTALEDLQLWGNVNLAGIDALLANSGLGDGDAVSLSQTAVSCTDIAALRAKGVDVLAAC